MKNSIEEFLHKSGRHKGSLNQDLLQCDGEFVHREPHPSVDGILFNNSNNGKQIWKKEGTYGKLKDIESPKGVPPRLIDCIAKSVKASCVALPLIAAMPLEGILSVEAKNLSSAGLANPDLGNASITGILTSPGTGRLDVVSLPIGDLGG